MISSQWGKGPIRRVSMDGACRITSPEYYFSCLEELKLGHMIGEGSYASVFYAEDKLGNKFAVKKVDKRKTDINFIKREVKLGTALRHANLAKIFCSFEDKDFAYILMEYIEGSDLFEYLTNELEENCAMEVDSVRKLFWDIAKVVKFCHENGYYHRDLKLENILLDNDGQPKLIDFGFCFEGTPFDKCIEMLGSTDYACPEILSRLPYSPEKADVWSLGVILYVLLFVELPFDRKMRVQFVQRRIPQHPDIIINEDELVPNEAWQLLRQMMEVDPKKRIGMKQVLEHPFLVGIPNA